MKVILLAGGFGTRISEYTQKLPKPMIPIGGKPILWHIMSIYSNYGYNDFCVALGYKAEVVKDYFKNFSSQHSDFTVNLATGKMDVHQQNAPDWNVTLVDTGLNTQTGGRVKRFKEFIGNEPFLLTYGDGVSNVDIKKLVSFHKAQGKLVTLTAVRPNARFGELEIDGNNVSKFEEKPQLHQGWINGGYFVIEPEFLELIDDDQTVLEREPFERAAQMGELSAYKHDGFWQCMDTARDREILEKLYTSKDVTWG